ncbi:MAG: hypothetical protein IKP69_00820, partial [Oscillospiraceae bacterium]|nr:hypothetical protein [Oscillospiraceae bacterium]
IKEISSHAGNVWTQVVSLRREDAQRMGYDNLNAWKELIKRQIPNIARWSKIDLANLKWYAAFHDKETNPHVHIIVYSTDPKEGFLTKQGIEKIRSGFANDIYHDELYHLYNQQTDVRNQIKNLTADRIRKISQQISKNQNPDAELLQLVKLLSEQLKTAKGKKIYGYLKKDTKKTVDLIFLRLAQDKNIMQMYALWCEMEQAKHDVYSSTKVDFPELVDNPQFRSVKNMIIKTVSELEDNQKQNQMLADTAFRLLVNLSRIIEEDYNQSERTLQSQTDSKLRQIIRRKKLELGIKEGQTSIQNY